MPRVLQVLEATIGGTRRHLRELALGMQAAGWQVDVAYGLGRDPGFARDLARFQLRGIGTHVLPMVRRPAPLADLAAVNRLADLLRRLAPDLIHAHSSKAGFIARLAGRRAGIPVLYTPHVFAFDMQVSPLLRRAFRAVERRLVPLTACLIAVSRAEQAAALALGYAPARVRCIPNGIPLAPDSSPPPRDGRRYDVVFIGRFCRQKGIDLMIKALAELLARRPGLRVAVMGGGSQAIERWLAALRGPVTCMPFDEAEAVEHLLAESRVLVMPSRWEGLPYLLLEAMAAGTAVAAADVGGVTDVVTDGREALLFAPESVAAIGQAVERLLDDEPLRRCLVGAARARVQAFGLDCMLGATRACYEEFRC